VIRRAAIPLLFFVSGFTGLVYEVLWVDDLGRLFGNTAQAAATTLAVFFLGLAAGGAFWGRRTSRLADPLVTYGWLEIGVGAAGALYFVLYDAYLALYGPLYVALHDQPALMTAARFALSAGILFPAAFLMGGTFPLLGERLARGSGRLGRVGSFLYGVNTAGAALGALAAGFFLPLALGFRMAYGVAIAISAAVGLAALALAWAEGSCRGAATSVSPPDEPAAPAGSIPGIVLTVAFASGFLTLGLEVAWTRMFAQVLQNSVYTFATILVVFLVSLGIGAFVANRLCRIATAPEKVLTIVLLVAGVLAAAAPFVFVDLTGGLGYVGSGEGWSDYLVSIFTAAAFVLLVPGIAIGAVFPYLLRMSERGSLGPGAAIGRLAALNTTGAVVGSVVAGFVLLGALGLWGTTRFLAVGYPLLAAGLVAAGPSRRPGLLGVSLVTVLLLVTVLDPTRLPLLLIRPGERIVETWEGSHGVVAVVERDGDRRIKVNNYYSLGGTASLEHERNQALLPILVHPSPERVFFLGMGTGITAGASLRLPVERVAVTELVPEVVTAARLHFEPWAGGLFEDPRVEILVTDGRNHLAGSDETYDVVVSDLFIPWKAGTGSLYSREHYARARERLRPGGAYVQWLPLYQLTSGEFYAIARTMLDAFPDVLVWRGDFFAEKPIVALVGRLEEEPLDPAVLVRHGRALGGGRGLPDEVYAAVTLPFYAGNLGRARDLVPRGPLNTDDRPWIEYRAPISHRQARGGSAEWFVGLELIDFFERLRERVPPGGDPYLARLDPAGLDYVRAGSSYHAASVYRNVGRLEEAERHYRDFTAAVPERFAPATDDRAAYSEFGE